MLSFRSLRANVEKAAIEGDVELKPSGEASAGTGDWRTEMRILIAEDDRALRLFLQRGLESDGHRMIAVEDGEQAVEAFSAEWPDLTILDLNMPRKDGECVLDEVRRMDAELPVLILTGRQDLETRVRCLEHGADDLMLKPFSLAELRARCRALMRRKIQVKTLLRVRNLEVNRIDRSVKRDGRSVTLTNTEFALLEQLMLHRGNCLSRSELLRRVWKVGSTQTTNIVDVYINYLRRKLDDSRSESIIRTLHGKGYMIPFVVGAETASAAAN
jgi:DNA-binding response OmpR family regulator